MDQMGSDSRVKSIAVVQMNSGEIREARGKGNSSNEMIIGPKWENQERKE